MITTIIFSKNRACQLDLLLRSIDKNFSNVSTDIRVLYRATNQSFKNGYEKLSSKFNSVSLIEEKDFQQDTIDLLKGSEDHICFFVDDNIVYRKPKILYGHIIELFKLYDELGCFSFRLGLNVKVQDPYTGALINPLPLMEYFSASDSENICAWDWTTLPLNSFGYPFSVDGHAYNTKLILDSLGYEFNTPNALEGRFSMRKIPRGMCCLETSSVVNNPINLVGSSKNMAGKLYGQTLENLNNKYLDGRQIDLESLCKNDISCCHQEMEITYE